MSLPYETAAALPWGSRVLTIATVEYVAENVTFDASSFVFERQSALGAPNGAVAVAEAITGSATLQLATDTTAIPARGAEFTETVHGSSRTFFLTQVGQPEASRAFKTVAIQFREKV